MDMMTRTIIALEPRQIALLKNTAATQNLSVSALIRKAVDLLLQKKENNPANLMLKSLAEIEKKFPAQGKKTNDSLNVDKIVYGL